MKELTPIKHTQHIVIFAETQHCSLTYLSPVKQQCHCIVYQRSAKITQQGQKHTPCSLQHTCNMQQPYSVCYLGSLGKFPDISSLMILIG
jgi:hypothetical protein